VPPNIFCHKGCREPKKVEKHCTTHFCSQYCDIAINIHLTIFSNWFLLTNLQNVMKRMLGFLRYYLGS
jgi:hypothetical protein